MRAKLLEMRKKAHYNQTKLAEKVGITQAWYSMIETGTVPLSKTVGLALCYVLKCDFEDLIDNFADRILGEYENEES